MSASTSIVRMCYLGDVVSCLAHPPIEECYQRNILKLFLYKQSILTEDIVLVNLGSTLGLGLGVLEGLALGRSLGVPNIVLDDIRKLC